MSDQPSKLSMRRRLSVRMKEGFKKTLRTRRNHQGELIEAQEGPSSPPLLLGPPPPHLQGPSPPFLLGPPRQESVQDLQKRQKEWKFTQRRLELIGDLDNIYGKAYGFDKEFFDPATYDKLKIRCETLDLNDDKEYEKEMNFFVPFPLETLTKHQIITPDGKARCDYEAHEDIFDKSKPGFGSRELYYRLIWHFECFRRNEITEGAGRLIDITVWEKDAYPKFIQEFFESGVCFESSHRPAAWWTAKSTPLPHLMCIVDHSSKGSEDISRGEILTILATTITRLELESYQGEVVIPVLMFSVMSDFKARIIQAFFDGDKLVIRKSKLYDFSTRETLSSSTTLFMRWMASKPVGDTSGFALADFVPFEKEDNTKSSIKEESETKGTADAP